MENLLEKEISGLINETNENIDDMESIINDYINFIEKNVPVEFLESFGVGVAGSHSQFGNQYGFYVSDDDYCGEHYVCAGNGYYIGGDFNAWVNGSNSEQMKAFLDNIHKWVENGKKALTEFNFSVKEIIGKLEK